MESKLEAETATATSRRRGRRGQQQEQSRKMGCKPEGEHVTTRPAKITHSRTHAKKKSTHMHRAHLYDARRGGGTEGRGGRGGEEEETCHNAG